MGADVLTGFDAYLRLRVAHGDPSEHTIRSYETNVRQWLAWCAGQSIKPTAASEDDVLAYRHDLIADYARGTVAVKLAAARKWFEFAQHEGLCDANPAESVSAPPDRTERHERIRYLSLDGLRRVLDAPTGDSTAAIRDRAILALMGKHGMRVAEVAGLDVGSVDLESNVIDVVGKGQKGRTLHLVDSTTETLQQWLVIREVHAEEGETALFVGLGHNGGGTRLTTEGARWIVNGYLAKLGLKENGISCHSLRHSAATWARFAGAKIDALADMLGHASVDTTRVYARITDAIKENPSRFLEIALREVA